MAKAVPLSVCTSWVPPSRTHAADRARALGTFELRGAVVETVEKGAVQHMNALAKKYFGLDEYPNHNRKDVRAIYVIEPDGFSEMG